VASGLVAIVSPFTHQRLSPHDVPNGRAPYRHSLSRITPPPISTHYASLATWPIGALGQGRIKPNQHAVESSVLPEAD